MIDRFIVAHEGEAVGHRRAADPGPLMLTGEVLLWAAALLAAVTGAAYLRAALRKIDS